MADTDTDADTGTDTSGSARSASAATGSASGAAREPVAYRETTRADYAATYAQAVDVVPVNQETVVLSGRCPRCGCACTYLHVRRAYRGPSHRADGIPVICTCETAHPGRPEDETGCGAYWNVRLEHG
ncbi:MULTISPECIES: hypothetical protein [unclassified Streptomyces]|uniref:hypothetical protein n=1 Tax=unclassified Streptomyces TaxID=2593676 RepID=UPI00332F88A9